MKSIFDKSKIKEETFNETRAIGTDSSTFQVDKALPVILNESSFGSEAFSFNFFDNKSINSSKPLVDRDHQLVKKKKKKKKKKNTNSGTIVNSDSADNSDEEENEGEAVVREPTPNKSSEQGSTTAKESNEVKKALTTAMKNLSLQPEAKIVTNESEIVKPKSKKDSKKEQQSKKSKSKQKPNEDDDMAFLDSVIAEQKKQQDADKSKKKNKKAVVGSGPSFISSKDPLLNTEQQKLLKFGKAKNLVSTGGMKIKDPNWLGDQTAEENSAAGRNRNQETILDDSRVIRPPPSTQTAESVVYHHSPFTFSFGGL
jgi:hypothetical protein